MKKGLIIGLMVSMVCSGWSQEKTIEVDHTLPGKSKIIPIAISGFSGEVAKVIQFDLEVLGFEVVPADRADFTLVGSNANGVSGTLSLAKGGKIWSGGFKESNRVSAHAFSDEIIKRLRGTNMPIARTQIVYIQGTPNNMKLIYSDYDGAKPQELTPAVNILACPSLHRGRVFYTSYETARRPWIYAQSLSSGVVKPIARFAGLNDGAAVSPDGSKMALIMDQGGSPDLWVMDLTSGATTRLTRTKNEIESGPTWSPDGSLICFSQDGAGPAGLYVVPPTGGTPRRLSFTGGASHLTEPSWSPDGSQIAFTSGSVSFQIWVGPANGGAARILVDGENPSWSPNSRTMIFARKGGKGGTTLSLLDVPTGKVKDVPNLSGKSAQPYWAK